MNESKTFRMLAALRLRRTVHTRHGYFILPYGSRLASSIISRNCPPASRAREHSILLHPHKNTPDQPQNWDKRSPEVGLSSHINIVKSSFFENWCVTEGANTREYALGQFPAIVERADEYVNSVAFCHAAAVAGANLKRI